MKIYTKKGDEGKTSLIGGTRVPKHHIRIDAYGTVDELNAHLGMLRDLSKNDRHREIILQIQDRLFVLGSNLAEDPETSRMALPRVSDEDVAMIENEIDRLESGLPALKSFLLPGGNTTVSQAHIARCICRRAERLVVRLDAEISQDPIILKYLNRLSDFLFVLSRDIARETGAAEIPWNPKHGKPE